MPTRTFNIPGSDMSNNGMSLDIKAATADGADTNVVPASGTIGGLPGITFPDTGCNLFLRSNGTHKDWIIRCLCCYTPTPFVPTGGVHFTNVVYGLDIPAEESTLAGGPATSSTVSLSIHLLNGGPSVNWPPQILVALIANHISGGLTTTVSSVSDDHGLSWLKRKSLTAGSPQLEIEIWWADAHTLPSGTNVAVTATFAGAAYLPFINLLEIAGSVAFPQVWDSNGALPATAVNTLTTPVVSGVSTSSTNAMLIVWFITSNFFGIGLGGGIQQEIAGTDTIGSPPPPFPIASSGVGAIGDPSASVSNPTTEELFAYSAYFDGANAGGLNNVTITPFAGSTEAQPSIITTTAFNEHNKQYILIADAIAGLP